VFALEEHYYLVVKFTALLTLFCFVSTCVLLKVFLAFRAGECTEIGLRVASII
jgi:hypothetical protein